MRQRQAYPLIRLQPRDDTLAVAQGRTVFATGRDGFIDSGSAHGLFVHETRMISQYGYRINGAAPRLAAQSNVEQHSWLGYYVVLTPGAVVSEPDTGSGLAYPASEHTLELRLARCAGEGLHEDVDLTNYSVFDTTFELALDVEADFADQVEVRGPRLQHGDLQRSWRQAGEGAWELVFSYVAEPARHAQDGREPPLQRGLILRVESAGTAPEYDGQALRFRVALAPRATWHACINLIPVIEDETEAADGDRPSYACVSFGGLQSEQDRRRAGFLAEATAFSSSAGRTLAPVVVGALEQAKLDLAGLRLYDLDHGEKAWTPAAGFPIYLALFGRDALTAAWQAALASPQIMVGSAYELMRWQGTAIDDWRDEQPGKMLHEAHTGPLEVLNYNPRRRYYGSVTTSGFYPVVVSELWHWTGDKELVRPLIEPALKALRWLDEWSDPDGDGFYEYQTRSSQGNRHQAWKDSHDAIVYEDGRPVTPPIATCEEQGFVYLAKLHMSEVLWWLGEKEAARRLFREASELKKRFNEAFWMDDLGFYAMGLDAGKRHIRSIGSNAGHLLAAGIADQDLVRPAAARLFADDLFSGWGIRTLSTENPAYNPYSYHRGSVWPVEQATFALGFVRYGLHDLAEQICRAQFEAASLFDYDRLPEVFSGHTRDDSHPFPALYPQTNWPQAWSASAVLLLAQSLLGLYPYAPLNLLLVDPHLPAWLPDLTLHGLKVGEAVATIQFYHKDDGSSDYRVLEVAGRLHVFRQPSPWSLTAGFAERLVDVLTSLLPGK